MAGGQAAHAKAAEPLNLRLWRAGNQLVLVAELIVEQLEWLLVALLMQMLPGQVRTMREHGQDWGPAD